MDVVGFGGEKFTLNNLLFSGQDEDKDDDFELIDTNRTEISQSRASNDSFNQVLEDDEIIYYSLPTSVLMTNQLTPESSQIDSSESPMYIMESDPTGQWIYNVQLYDDTNTISEDENQLLNSINIPVFMSKCIDPDQMLNDEHKSSTSCLLDSLSDFDLQEQILIEDRHQGLQQNDEQIPIDEYSERMQYKLITDITGKDEKSAVLGIVNSLKTSTSTETEVQNVEITPGSQDLTIEGIKFSLPNGSTILAVTNDTTDELNETLNGDVSSFNSLFFDPSELSQEEDDHMFDVSIPIHDLSGMRNISDAIALEETTTAKEMITSESNLSSSFVNDVTVHINTENDKLDENDFEGFEVEEKNCPDETLLPSVPVIEAQDLDALIMEYESSEAKNFQLSKIALNDDDVLDETFAVREDKDETAVESGVNHVEPSSSKKSVMAKKPKGSRKNSGMSLIERHNLRKVQQMKAHKAHQKIRDSIPVEIIEKIKASGKRSCTKILTEALIPRLRRKMAAKSIRAAKKLNAKKKCRNKNRPASPEKENEIEELVSIPPPDHEYCRSPVKKQIKIEREEIPEITEPLFNKIPEYCQMVVKIKTGHQPELNEDSSKKDSGVDSGNVSDSSLFEAEERRNRAIPEAADQMIIKQEVDEDVVIQEDIKQEVDKDVIIKEDDNMYSRLPDYVTDIGNAKTKEEEEEEVSIKEEPLDDYTESLKPELEECLCEPFKEEPKKKKKLNLSEYRMRKKNSADNSRCNSPYLDDKRHYSTSHVINLTDEGEEGEIKEEVVGNAIPKSASTPVEIKRNCEPITKSSVSVGKKDKSPKTKHSKRPPHGKSTAVAVATKSSANVIEIDLEKEEEEKEREERIKVKLGFVSKMPSTSLGHCLLYSKKNSAESNENKSSASSFRKSSRKGRYTSSQSRSRSRSYSSKSSSRYRKSRGSKHSNHRKSRRRSSRSRSRGRSKSRSSVISVRSFSSSHTSRSRSRSYSKSYHSKSRSSSRSRSSRRKYRYKRHSRSRERSRRPSGSRSSSNWGTRSRYESPTYDRYYGYSTHDGYHSYVPSDYPVCHKMPKEMGREEERRIIYVGGIEDGVTRAELRRRFERFGQVTDISIHFREKGDNYGFITFRHKEDAYGAMERGNDDPSLPWYKLCFGGRRNFCKEEYADLDAQKDDHDFYNASFMDFDTLLTTTTTLQMRR